MSSVQLGDHMFIMQLLDNVYNYCLGGLCLVFWFCGLMLHHYSLHSYGLWLFLLEKKEMPTIPKLWADNMSGVQLGDHMSGLQFVDSIYNYC
jgi:hypothetical protein